MLEREGNYVLDPLNWHGEGISRETLAEDDLDPAEIVSRTPVILVKEFLAEIRELQRLEITILREFWLIVRASMFMTLREGLTKAMRKNVRPVTLAVKSSGSFLASVPFLCRRDTDLRYELTINEEPRLKHNGVGEACARLGEL